LVGNLVHISFSTTLFPLFGWFSLIVWLSW
jgi:hypothetical protein